MGFNLELTNTGFGANADPRIADEYNGARVMSDRVPRFASDPRQVRCRTALGIARATAVRAATDRKVDPEQAADVAEAAFLPAWSISLRFEATLFASRSGIEYQRADAPVGHMATKILAAALHSYDRAELTNVERSLLAGAAAYDTGSGHHDVLPAERYALEVSMCAVACHLATATRAQ